MTTTLLPGDSAAKIILNAFPSPMFIVDKEVRVLEMNAAALDYFSCSSFPWGHRLCGDVLRCANTQECQEDCGQTRFCRDCVIRQAVGTAVSGSQTTRRWTEMHLLRKGERQRVCFLVSLSPFKLENTELFLLVLEDVTEVAELRQLIPICASCGKARSGENYWQSVHEYLDKYTAVKFSHSLCPACMVNLYGELGKDIEGSTHSSTEPTPPDNTGPIV